MRKQKRNPEFFNQLRLKFPISVFDSSSIIGFFIFIFRVCLIFFFWILRVLNEKLVCLVCRGKCQWCRLSTARRWRGGSRRWAV